MTIGRALSLFAAIIVIFGGLNLAYAEVPNVDIGDVPQVEIHVNPDVPSASDINCEIFADLVANGQPIPPGFDSSGCDDNGGGGGGGGGSSPACSDGVDNDGDGLVDSNDPGCSDATDTDETNPASPPGGGGGDGGGGGGGGGSGGGGGGGGGSGAGGGSATTTSATSTVETAPVESTLPIVSSCDMYLTSFIRTGAKNDSEQVKRLQSLLAESEGADLEMNGLYDANTLAAVHAFQTKYASDILTPWGATKSTGFVYLTTRKKMNEIYCKLTKEFPLSSEEINSIAKVRTQIGSATPTAPKAPTPSKITPAPNAVTPEVGSAPQVTQAAAAGNESATRSLNRLWTPITNLFGRIFGR